MTATKMKIKKGDRVKVITGKYRGEEGEVIKSFPSESKVLVRGVNVVKRHVKPSRTGSGGIESKELPVHVSNVALIEPSSGKAVKVGWKFLEDGKKVRISRKSGEVID